MVLMVTPRQSRAFSHAKWNLSHLNPSEAPWQASQPLHSHTQEGRVPQKRDCRFCYSCAGRRKRWTNRDNDAFTKLPERYVILKFDTTSYKYKDILKRLLGPMT